MVTALASAADQGGDLAPAADFILGNISNRMADALREEIEERGRVKPREGETAMTEVVNAIRTLEARGEITLVSQDDEEDADG